MQNHHELDLASILISNLIFGTFRLGLGEEVAGIVMIFGLYFCWLYSKQRSLLGVSIAHALIGMLGMDVLNLKSWF